jgi:hypothetical protein
MGSKTSPYSQQFLKHKSDKYPDGMPPRQMTYPEGYRTKLQIENQMLGLGDDGEHLKNIAFIRPNIARGYKTGDATKAFNAQMQPYDASLAAGGARWGYHQDTKIFEQEYLTRLGLSRAKWGAFGTYAGGRASLNSWGIGQNRASDPMMAQMSASSNMSSGQDLYIANANIGSTNLQDLFYNSDQLTG